MRLFRAILFFIATILLYFGVPLLGWGLGDLAGFFTSIPRLGYSVVVGLFSLAIGIQAYASTQGIRGGKGEEGKFVFRQRIVGIVLVISLYIALFFIPFFDRHALLVFTKEGFAHWLGVGLSALGFALIFWSGLALGKQYSADVTIQVGHRLITNGIYHTIRHPRYLGVIVLSIGVSCIFRCWVGLVACVFFLCLILFRIMDEEAMMKKEFGEEWEAYCKRSWRLLPYIL